MRIKRDNNYVNIIHFPGNSIDYFLKLIDLILHYNTVNLNPINESELTIFSCWTNDDKCILYQQCKNQNINLYNCLPKDYDKSQEWYMPNKIRFILDYLKNKVTTEITLILDGYDVLIMNTDDLLKKFKNQKYRILFNGTVGKYPLEDIEYIEDRDTFGAKKYFNAGCCIGYTKDLIKFYEECLEYIDIDNPIKSEQKIIRTAFSKYSNDKNQNFVYFEYIPNIFLTMSMINLVVKTDEIDTYEAKDADELYEINKNI